MSKKEKSLERRRAQDIRCQVKKGYESRIAELEEKVIAYAGIIERQDKEIKSLKYELRVAQSKNHTVSSFYAMMNLLGEGGGVAADS